MNLSFWAAALGVGVTAFMTGLVALPLTSRASARREAAERRRLNNEVFGGYAFATSVGEALRRLDAEEPPRPDAEEPPRPDAEAPPGRVRPGGRVPSRDAVYDQLLVNDYALGLTQARVAFNVSMAFSILGGLVLVLGVALAIFRAATGGQVAGAAITSAAGVLTSGLSQLFRGQSTKTLKHLEAQAVELRKDVRTQTNAGTAERLLGEISDPDLRSRLQAALILQFTGATLPDLGRAPQPEPGTFNGIARSPEVTELPDPSA